MLKFSILRHQAAHEGTGGKNQGLLQATKQIGTIYLSACSSLI